MRLSDTGSNNGMTIKMENNAASFFGGFIVSVFANVQWIFLQVGSQNPAMMAKEFGLKVLGTFILGVIGGLAGILGKELYSVLKKNKNEKENDRTVS